jgi:predicted nuclease of predicted toxin-antitoxin system
MRLLADEDIPRPSVVLIRADGHDVHAIAESHPSELDIDVLAIARTEGRVLVTRDRDFGDLIFKDRLLPPPAILYVRLRRVRPQTYGEVVNQFLRIEAEMIEGHFIVLEAGLKVRRRRFPTPNSSS